MLPSEAGVTLRDRDYEHTKENTYSESSPTEMNWSISLQFNCKQHQNYYIYISAVQNFQGSSKKDNISKKRMSSKKGLRM